MFDLKLMIITILLLKDHLRTFSKVVYHLEAPKATHMLKAISQMESTTYHVIDEKCGIIVKDFRI